MGELTERDEDIIRTSVNFRSKYNEATLLWKKKRSSILVNCPECVSREIEKKKKELEAEFNAAEEEGREFRVPAYREMEDEIDFEGLGLIMKLDPSTKHFICKRCGLYATREQISDIRYKLSRKEATRADKQYDYLDWWQKSKKEKEAE